MTLDPLTPAVVDDLIRCGGAKLVKVLLDLADRGVDLTVRLLDLPSPDGTTLYIETSCYNRRAGLPTADERGRLVAAMWTDLRLHLHQHCGCGEHFQDRLQLFVNLTRPS